MNRILNYLPEVTGEELSYIHNITKELEEKQLETFAHIYRARRRDPQTVLIIALVGLFVIPGLQRFYVDQIGLGILYLLTLGLCFIGSIIDIVNYKSLAQEYNSKVANDALVGVR
ncbi:TM2 domain-containing protein [Fulvivirga sp. RKSG066]|uniref:TM2 domain-containing protein n=1 Tax=Fulvivirga aurantia TaxID=2529383 RepID=UPI0012BD821C|nr:TM2 domain-containing protein [Fulvivirga aurantia]MTI20305.1 TM2 domain-containing protein [Fulvivirga aurantia]